MPSRPKIAVDKKLLKRLPRSFLPILDEQLNQWEELFPAEQRLIGGTLRRLSALPDEELAKLVAPVKDVEAKMRLPEWSPKSDRLSIEETSMLARSPHYSEWREEVSKFFEAVESKGEPAARGNRVVLNLMPAGLPINSQPLWPRLAKKGRWLQLERAFGEDAGGFIDGLVDREAAPGAEPVERTWILDGGRRWGAVKPGEATVRLSYPGLEPVRREFSRRLNEIDKNLRSVDQTYDELRRLKLERLLPSRLATDARVREFLRNLFLSGNGAVNFCNSFVQWGASEAMRRAQPRALVCGFGIRPKLKPFSSLVLFEDQNRANPVPDEPDPAGSLIDIQMLAEYVHLMTERLPSYNERTATLFAAADSDLALLIAPKQFPPLPSQKDGPLAAGLLRDRMLDWLSRG